eukprot:1655296-Rhodomonas_salina.2
MAYTATRRPVLTWRIPPPPEIKYKKPQSQHNLYQESGFLYLVSRGARRPALTWHMLLRADAHSRPTELRGYQLRGSYLPTHPSVSLSVFLSIHPSTGRNRKQKIAFLVQMVLKRLQFVFDFGLCVPEHWCCEIKAFLVPTVLRLRAFVFDFPAHAISTATPACYATSTP